MNPKNWKTKGSKASKTMPNKKVKNVSVNSANKVNITEEDKKSNTIKKAEKAKVIKEEPKKNETSSNFIFTRTLSKIYSKLNVSKDNLDKCKSDTPGPKPMQRSLTLNSFQLKKNYNKLFPENRLEKLSEEKVYDNEKTNHSPPDTPSDTPIRSKDLKGHRQSMPPGSFNDFDYGSYKLERSNSFISLIRRKMSFTDTSKSDSMKSKWANSLQNLQQIDNMVSYEDLSFVDYDKFNQYEHQIDKVLMGQKSINSLVSVNPMEAINHSVVRLRPKKTNQQIDYVNRQLDREKNLYRQSLDSSKLNFLRSNHSDSNFSSREFNNIAADSRSLDSQDRM